MPTAFDELRTTHLSTGRNFSADYLVSAQPTSSDKVFNLEPSLVEEINLIDLEYVALQASCSEIGNPLDYQEKTRNFRASLQDQLRALIKRLSRTQALSATNQRLQTQNSTEVQRELTELPQLIGYLKTLLEASPPPLSEPELRAAIVIHSIGQDGGLPESSMPTPFQLKEMVFRILDSTLVEETREDVSLVYHQLSYGDGETTLFGLYHILENQSKHPKITQYIQSFTEGGIFALGYWRTRTRKLRNAAHEKYIKADHLKDVLDLESGFSKDGSLLEIMEAGGKINDAWSATTPSVERMRTAEALYGNLDIIKLIRDKMGEQISTQAGAVPYFWNLASQNQLYRQHLPPNWQTLNRQEVSLMVAAKVLQRQKGMEWITQSEAEFLLRNFVGLMPKEKTTRDSELQTRACLQLLTSVGPVRNDTYRSPREKSLNLILNGNLLVRAENGSIRYSFKNSAGQVVQISSGSHNSTVMNNSGQQVTSDTFTLLEQMRTSGRIIEDGAYDLAWPTLQMAQADAGYTWGFMKEPVALSRHFDIAQRYKLTDYAGYNLRMAAIVKRLHITWQEHSMVPVTNPTSNITEERSLHRLYCDASVNMSDQAYVGLYKRIEQVEDRRGADNLSRALDMKKLMDEGIFTFIGVPFKSFALSGGENIAQGGLAEIEAEKIKTGFRKANKVIKYFVEMFPLEELVEEIIRHKPSLLAEASRVAGNTPWSQVGSPNREVIQRIVTEDILLDIVEVSLVDQIKKVPHAGKIDDFMRDKALRDDLLVLKRFLVIPGRVRSGVKPPVSNSSNQEAYRPLVLTGQDDQEPKELFGPGADPFKGSRVGSMFARAVQQASLIVNQYDTLSKSAAAASSPYNLWVKE